MKFLIPQDVATTAIPGADQLKYASHDLRQILSIHHTAICNNYHKRRCST